MAAIQIYDYPVSPRPRWGHGRPANKILVDALSVNRDSYEEILRKFVGFKPLLHLVPHTVPEFDLLSPYWDQVWFSCLDAVSLVCFLGDRRPKKYIEIGSGNSTKFARFAVKSLYLPTHITSIDPHPRAEIDLICDTVIRTALEDTDLSIFDTLEKGDILFFDGSHRLFTNSDVSVFFFEILPRIKAGVLVHVHDIFLPDDYPDAWNDLFFSEQYVLASLLMSKQSSIKPVLPNYFVYKDDLLRPTLKDLMSMNGNEIPLTYVNSGDTPGVSFWFEADF